jgi:hypothetical protein
MSSDQCDKDDARPKTEKKKTQDDREMRLSGEVMYDMIGVHENSDTAANKETTPPKMKCKPSQWMMYSRS